jgi:hypothetical protein
MKILDCRMATKILGIENEFWLPSEQSRSLVVTKIDCVNRKLAIKKFQVPIFSQLNSFLVVIHNRGSPCVIKFFCA